MAVASFALLGIGRVPGYAPGSAVTFCATESHQRTPALLSVSPCCARGSLWCSRAGRAAELTSRCALRSNNCGKSEVEVGGVLRHPQPSRALRSSARTQGPWTAGNQTATRAIAALGPVLAPSPAGEGWNGAPTGGRAQRWPVWFPKPLWMRLRRGVCGVRRRTHFAAAQLRSDNRGESVNEA